MNFSNLAAIKPETFKINSYLFLNYANRVKIEEANYELMYQAITTTNTKQYNELKTKQYKQK